MPVKQNIPHNSGLFFITFTCYQWLPLIDKVNGYDIIYNWFDYLKSKGHYINGYVIMPNHIHVLMSKEFCWQKLDYIHNNPCAGKWQLAVNAIEYIHSSAKYYLTGEQGVYTVTNFMEMEDVAFGGSRQ